ncbi:MAG: 50S ribosomal protein L18e [Thermoplasmata archaeon]|jgi:large subunit ribosomal protein L18e|nr:50S ribosomal protein L18e [Thermoplasmata archaeon]MCI4341944.1 50S ribosomal protein L18e [Thermoplasmata archaeon]
MLRTIRKGDPELRATLIELRKASRSHHAPIWAAVAERLDRPRHQIQPVNVSRLERIARESETVVVAGKLLAAGTLRKKVTVAAYRFSVGAREKVQSAGGQAITIHELIHSNAEGKGVRLLG